jgi:predicted transposase YbfD/YdcC
VDIKGALITIDAMGTQKAIAEKIIDGEADYVLALKGNHETLHQAVIDYIDEQSENDFATVTARRHVTEETGHGRQETRCSAPQKLDRCIMEGWVLKEGASTWRSDDSSAGSSRRRWSWTC